MTGTGMECGDQAVWESQLPLPLVARGKVRDVYALGEDKLLFLATDRISAFDCVLPTPIPCKGRVLTQMSLFWFDLLKNIMPSHLSHASAVACDAALTPYSDLLDGRSVVVKRAQMIEVECVARGYLAGSGTKEYRASGTVCGIPLPAGLRDGDQLPEPLFTPALKAHSGHDENVPFSRVEALLGKPLANELRTRTLDLYGIAAAYVAQRGILLADTKFEFGFIDGTLTLADEVLTPDSSRWWPADQHRPGHPQPSYDKQYVRDYLEKQTWDKKPPAPSLPPEVVRQTTARYLQAFERITERRL